MSSKFRVSGTGCCLVDRLYNNISFDSEYITSHMSGKRGDGGLTPGQLVFQEELEKYSKKDFQQILQEITLGRQPDKINIGGPAIVAMIHAAQITEDPECTYHFYGYGGTDSEGEFLQASLKKTPVLLDHYRLCGTPTPSTVVLSDPGYNQGHGERMFINSIGAAWDFGPENLDEEFFASEVVIFGGTALVPRIHDHLTQLLEKAKSNGCITVVNTVFDFRNEKAFPGKKWPLGKSNESYGLTDLLIMDLEEALRLSGEKDIRSAMQFFRNQGTGTVIITNGSANILVYSGGSLFETFDETEMPVSRVVIDEVKKGKAGDTTGCGDNFVGGVIASMVNQIMAGSGKPDLIEAGTWGIVSGGYTCFYLGGTYLEQNPGEKHRNLLPYYQQYKNQIHG